VPVPFLDLARRHALVAGSVERRVIEVLRSGQYVGGPVVAEAEATAARWLGRRHGVGVASGTDALILSLQVLGVGPGDEVIVPALTFFATAGAVLATGAAPVLADVGDDGLLDPIAAGELRGTRTRAVIPVHLYGGRCAPPDLGVPVIDDAAQAIGVEPPPADGALTALSAYPTKTWGAAGDAGFVLTDDDDLARAVRALGNHGQRRPGDFERVGGHAGRASRLDAVQAAVLLGHAEVLRDRVAHRRALARRYDEGLPAWVRPLPRSPGSAVHQYVVRVRDRDALARRLAARGVGTAVYYRSSLHAHPALAGCRAGPLPRATALADEVLALPIHDCTAAEVDEVIDALDRETE
jgi:dTDP-4-amino-4,6-dideoxygalactose transaminase